MSRFMLTCSRLWLLIWLVGLLVSGNSSSGQAPVPSGTIFYFSTTLNAMRADGSGKTQVLPSVSAGHVLFPRGADPTKPYALRGMPCDQVQGSDPMHDRWYLALVQTNTYDAVTRSNGSPVLNHPHLDLFAYRTDPLNRSQVIAIQLTDLYGIFAPSTGSSPDWSNDSNENSQSSFIALGSGRYIASSFQETTLSDGSTYSTFHADSSPSKAVRLPWTASVIQLQWLMGGVPYRPQSTAEFEALFAWFSGNSRGSSPDGLFYTASLTDRVISLFDHFQTGMVVKQLWNGNGKLEPKYPANPVWSRNGATIAFINEGNSVGTSNGGVWSIPTATGAPKQLAKNSVKAFKLTRTSDPLWSPDSNFIVYRSVTDGTANASELLRIPAGGGTAVNLTADLVPPASGFRWVSNTIAPLAP